MVMNANLQNLSFSIPLINSGIEQAILVDKSPVFQYENRKKVSENPIGTRYIVALQGNLLTTIAVKVEGADSLKNLKPDYIQDQTSASNFIYVEFAESVVKIYTINGEQKFSASAKSISLVDNTINFGGK